MFEFLLRYSQYFSSGAYYKRIYGFFMPQLSPLFITAATVRFLPGPPSKASGCQQLWINTIMGVYIVWSQKYFQSTFVLLRNIFIKLLCP